MADIIFAPPYTPLFDFDAAIARRGFAALSPADVQTLTAASAADLAAMQPSWNDLPEDEYLRDGGRYRHRRHASLIIEDGVSTLAPHRAHYQPVEYNALHGGMQRLFEPVSEATLSNPGWNRLILGLGETCTRLHGVRRWFVEAHQFRIDTGDGMGRPTPEGAHRDGVDFVAVLLVERDNIIGGETRVFDYAGPDGQRFTLDAPWSLLFMEDARVIHESTPIRPELDDQPGHRDTLVLTFRADGFLGD